MPWDPLKFRGSQLRVPACGEALWGFQEVAEVKALARTHTVTAINALVAITKSDKATDAARVSACVALLDRGERNHEPKRALYVRGALYIRGY